jgi:adenylate kinase family enzyme
MKNIFIGGAAKSGKSTIAEKICSKENYNHIPLDYFTASLKRNFPDVGIRSNVLIEGETSPKLALLLSTVFNIIDDTKEKFIIDSAHIMPKDIIKYIDLEKWDIIYVGYPNIKPQDKFNLIRKLEQKESWTHRRTDEELFPMIERLVEISKEIESQCKELNIRFIDTSGDIKDVLEEL